MNTIGYIRVSTQKQVDTGVSLEAQEAAIRSYCKTFGLTLGEVIEDAGASGKSLNRPGMSRLLAMIDAGEVGAVVIYKLDRAFRSQWDAMVVMKNLQQKDIAFHSVTEKLDTATAFGRAMVSILLTFGQMERELIGERTRDALQATKQSNGGNILLDYRKKAGKLVTGQAPFGYHYHPVAPGSKIKELVPWASEMTTVRFIRELAAEGHKPTQIKNYLEERGITPRHRKLWHPTQITRIIRATYY